MVALAPPTFAVTEHFPRSCPHISAHLGGWSIPPPPPILSCCVVYILYLDCLSSVDKHIKLFLLWHTYPSTCQIISNKPCIIPSSTGYCYSMSFSAKNYLETIYQNNILLFCNMPYHIFFYKVDIILTHHLHAFPNNTLLILFQTNYLETRRSPQNNFARQGLCLSCPKQKRNSASIRPSVWHRLDRCGVRALDQRSEVAGNRSWWRRRRGGRQPASLGRERKRETMRNIQKTQRVLLVK